MVAYNTLNMTFLDPTEGSTSVIRYRSSAVFFLLATCWLFGFNGVLLGQGFFRPPPNSPAGRLIEPPRTLEQKLNQAEESLEDDRPSDAILALGDLVARETDESAESDLATQDFFLDNAGVSEGKPATQSLLRKAQQMIGQLSESDWETYQLRFGPIAARLLDQASNSHDWNSVAEVRRRYLHTKAGYQATALLAQREIYRGHPLAASILLDDIVEIPRAVKLLGPAIVLMHAAAQFDSNTDGSQEPILTVDRSPIKNLFFGQDLRSTPIQKANKGSGANETATSSLNFPSTNELIEWLAVRSKNRLRYQDPPPKNHSMYGSTADRNGNSAGQLPLTNMRWALPTTASHLQERMVRDFTNGLAASGLLPPPSWMPLRVGDQLLMRTTERLVGVDYRTGKRVWTYPWQSGLEPAKDEAILFDELSEDEDTDERISGRIWNDVPYGQVTSDGDRVFMLTDLSDIKMASFNQSMMFRGTMEAENRTNTLVALEMETEGKLLWRLGQNGDPTSPLAQAFFLGPPLPLDGRLYVMAEVSGDILLCCLDPVNGNHLWQQHLVAIESGGIDTDALRRVSGAMPTYHEGMLICPTGAGACVAIHLLDRTLAWCAVYDRSNDMMRVNNRGRGLEPTKLMQRWDNGVAVGSGRKILVTPPESERLMGFDLLTGKPLFQYKNRVNMKYLAGIRDGKFLLVSSNEVRAYDLETGNLQWSSPQDLLAAGQHIAGRGIFGEDDYIVPTTTNELIQVSLKDGSVIERRSTRYPLGNLVAVEGDVIVQSPTMLAVAFGEKTLEPIVDRRLAKNPDDFDALVRKSELLIQNGKRREALDMLRHARQLQSDNDEVHLLSVSAMLGMLREDPEIGEEYIEELNSLIDRPAQRVELLSLRIEGAIKQQQWVKATRQALTLSNLLLGDDMAEVLARDIVNDPTRSCSLDCWLATKMAEVMSSSDPSQQTEINDLIRESAKDQIVKSNQICARWLRHFSPWPGAADAQEKLSNRYREADQLLAAERIAMGTQNVESIIAAKTLNQAPAEGEMTADFSSDSLATDPLATDHRLISLAQTYLRGGMANDVIGVLAAISEESKDEESKDQLKEGLQNQVAEMLKMAEAKMVPHDWPENVSLQWTSPNPGSRSGNSSKRTTETTVLSGEYFNGWRLTNEGRAPLALRSPLGIPRIIAIEGIQGIEARESEAIISGGTMLVTMSTGMVGIDLFKMLAGDASVLWRHPWGGEGTGKANRSQLSTPFGDQIFRRVLSTPTASPPDQIPELAVGPIIGDRCFVLQGGDLIALDVQSGEVLWRNSDAPKNGMVVSDGKQVAVVTDASNQVVYFGFGDGRKLNSIPWKHGKLWRTAGRYVLSFTGNQQNGSIYQTKLVDPFTDTVLLEQQTTGIYLRKDVPLSYGRVINGRFYCSLQSDGEALVWDIASGKEIAKLNLPAYKDLQGLSAIHLKDQFILAPKRKVVRTNRNNSGREVATVNGKDHQTVHAIFAISEQDGQLNWSKEFESPWGCTLDQAYGTPLLMLTRSPYVNTVSTRVRKKYMDILALDVNDGRVLKERLGKDILPGNNHLKTETIVQTGRNQVLVKIGNDEQLAFKFGVNEADKIESSIDKNNAQRMKEDELRRQLKLRPQVPRQ